METDQELIKLEDSGAFAILHLTGAAGVELAEVVHQAALQAADSGKDVVLDWTRAEHVDACSLQLLVALRAALVERGHALRVAGSNPAVEKYLTLAGLADHFPPASSADVRS